MGEVVRFPVERVEPFFDESRYRSEPAVILILPTVAVERETQAIWRSLPKYVPGDFSDDGSLAFGIPLFGRIDRSE